MTAQLNQFQRKLVFSQAHGLDVRTRQLQADFPWNSKFFSNVQPSRRVKIMSAFTTISNEPTQSKENDREWKIAYKLLISTTMQKRKHFERKNGTDCDTEQHYPSLFLAAWERRGNLKSVVWLDLHKPVNRWGFSRFCCQWMATSIYQLLTTICVGE